MKITILAFGTRGDVQPFIALGLGLKQAGHTITIAAPNDFEEFITSYELIYSSLQYDMSKDVEKALDDDLSGKKKSPLSYYREQMRDWPDYIRSWLNKSYEACQGCDVLIYTGLAMMYGIHIEDKLKVPSIPIYLGPVTPTETMPLFVFPDIKLGRWYNRTSYRLYSKSEWFLLGKTVNQWRKNQGLKEVNEKTVFHMKYHELKPTLYGFSSSVLPKPRDWGKYIFLPGYFFLDQASNWQPSSELLAFLEAGEQPMYIGFGSLNFLNNEKTIQIILEAAAKTHQRIVLATTWEGIKEMDLPDTVYVVNNVPHQWLFPRMKALVHHGGSGTTAEGLRAGRPTITVPLGIADVRFWSNQVHNIGAGPKPLRVKTLDASGLARAMNEVIHNSTIQERAEIVGEQIRSEDGVMNAVNSIHAILQDIY